MPQLKVDGLSAPPEAGREHPLFTHSMPVGLMSGENPRFPTATLGGHEELKRDLEAMGVQHEETHGHYGAPERSTVIYGLPREHLYALGQKYGQEAVIHNEGGKREFIYTGGPNAGKMHPGLPSYEHWPEGGEQPEDNYTKLPGNGYVRLHFDFDHVDAAPVMPNAPQPAPLSPPPPEGVEGTPGVPAHVGAEPQMSKSEALHLLYKKLKKMAPDPVELGAPKGAFKHPHAYQWHDGHTDQHYLGHASGGVLISSKLRKHDVPGAVKHPHTDGAIPNQQPPKNDQAAGAGVKTYHQFALPFGHIDHDAKARGGSNLFHYDYNGKNDAVNKLVADHGFQTYYAGGKFGKPDLAKRNYNTKHLMVYDPTPGSGGDFGDQTYTDSWRKTHELSHALVYPELNRMYGEGRRIGKLGVHRSLNEALRAVHWEHLAAHKQRELNAQLGIHVPDETFNREYNTVMHDAAHRAVTGKFTEPSEEGFVPHSHAVPLETSLGLVREAARNLGLTGMHDLVKKSEGAIAVADTKKSLNTREVLHELHKGLTAQVKDWEQKCLDLRKAELSKALPGELSKLPVSEGKAPSLPPPAPPVAKNDDLMCKETPMCKCGSCSRMEKYAKGEMPAGSDPTSPGPKPGVTPDDKKPKMAAPKSQEGGNDGTDVKPMKKAALPGAAPAPAAPKLPGAGGGMPKPAAAGGLPKLPKLPGMGKPAGAAPGGLPKPAAPAGGAKPPAMGAGTPALKTEMKKTTLPGSAPRPSGKPPQTRDQQAQAAKLPGVRASVGGLMDNMLAGGAKPLNPGQPLAIKPIASSAVKQPGAHISPGQGLTTKTPPAPSAAPPMVQSKAAAMPPGQPGSALTPPPAEGRPGAKLPGAHLFERRGAAPAPALQQHLSQLPTTKKPVA